MDQAAGRAADLAEEHLDRVGIARQKMPLAMIVLRLTAFGTQLIINAFQLAEI